MLRALPALMKVGWVRVDVATEGLAVYRPCAVEVHAQANCIVLEGVHEPAAKLAPMPATCAVRRLACAAELADFMEALCTNKLS